MPENMKRYILALTSLMVTLSSCQKESDTNNDADGEFRIEASLESEFKATNTDFEEADVIGVFVTEKDVPLTATGNYGGKGDNLEYTYTSSTWVKSGEPLRWKDNSATTVYGYYPRTGSVTDVADYAFSVPSDQSDQTKYNSADLLWAKKESVSYGNNATLLFAHKMSNVEITIKTATDAGIGAVTDVSIHGVLNLCSINLETGVVKPATGAPMMIFSTLQSGSQYRAILAPQTFTDMDFIVVTAMVDGVETTFKHHVSSLTLASGKKYTYTLTLTRNAIEVTVDNITDWTGKEDPAAGGEAEGGKIPTKALITSSFIQSWDLIGITADQINDYLEKLTEAGINEVVIDQAVYYSKYLENPAEYLSIVPITKSELESGVTSSSLNVNFGDKLETVLSYCEEHGIKVYVGLYYDNRQWWKDAMDSNELIRCIKMGNNAMDKILELYETKYPNALHGWYFSWEVNNVNLIPAGNSDILKGMFTALLEHINSKSVRRPLLMSPFANETGGMSATEYSSMWKDIFNNCPFKTGDIFAPQDCIGTGKISMGNYDKWMGAYADAVAGKPGMEFGINVEIFTGGVAEPFSSGRVKTQMENAARHATKILSFSYFFHYCRDQINHEAYLNYMKSL